MDVGTDMGQRGAVLPRLSVPPPPPRQTSVLRRRPHQSFLGLSDLRWLAKWGPGTGLLIGGYLVLLRSHGIRPLGLEGELGQMSVANSAAIVAGIAAVLSTILSFFISRRSTRVEESKVDQAAYEKALKYYDQTLDRQNQDLSRVYTQLDRVQSELDKEKNENSNLKGTVGVLQSQINIMQTQAGIMQSTIDDLRTTISELRALTGRTEARGSGA